MFLKLSSILAQDEFPPVEEPVAMPSNDLERISMAFSKILNPDLKRINYQPFYLAILYSVVLALAVLCLVFAIIHRKKLAHDLER